METALKMVLWSSIVYESECSEGHLPSIVSTRKLNTPPESQEMTTDASSESSEFDKQLEQVKTEKVSLSFCLLPPEDTCFLHFLDS